MNVWETWKKGFYAWENQTAKYLEGVLKSPVVLVPGGYMMGQMMKTRAATDKAMTSFWESMGLPTRHDQERVLHALNQLQSRIYDLEEEILEVQRKNES